MSGYIFLKADVFTSSTILIYQRVIIINIASMCFPPINIIIYIYTCNIIHKSTSSSCLYLYGSIQPKKAPFQAPYVLSLDVEKHVGCMVANVTIVLNGFFC